MRLSLGVLAVLMPQGLYAGGVALRFGPAGAGGGGTNPLALPPAAIDLGLSYVTDKGIEFDLALTHLAIALREQAKWGGYVSVGGGLAVSTQGAGLGPYAGFGMDLGCKNLSYCFSAEYSQAIGLGGSAMVTPYAVKIGIMKWFR